MNDLDFKQTDEFAPHYDEAVLKYGWHSPEVLFGLAFDWLNPGETLLDLGIGTGLSSVPFRKAGLNICGVDGSQKMLDHCASRGVAVELRQQDIRSTPLPFPDARFDHIIACGIFHLVGKLDDIFADVARLIRRTGTFAFTIEELIPDRLNEGELVETGLQKITNAESGIVSYLHSHSLMEKLLSQNDFHTTKTLDYLAYRKTPWANERTFRAYVALRVGGP